MRTSHKAWHRHAPLAACGALAWMLGTTGLARAQEAAPALGEIVVTANKSRENASKVPISIVAFSNAALQQSGIKSVADIGRVAPGVQFDQSNGLDNGTNTNIAIRGISSATGQSTTGIYLDDIPLQTRVASLSYFGNPLPALFDLERVEVERGPQGTLFGAGAEGGAVRFITREPGLTDYSGVVHGEASATQGGAPSLEGGVALGGPIVKDMIGFRASIWDRRDGGYVDRVDPFTGATVDRNANWSNTLAGRVALLFKPTDTVRITPAFYAQVYHQNDSNSFYLDMGDPARGAFVNGRLSAQPNTDRLRLPSLKIEIDLPGALTLTAVSSYMMRDGHASPNITGLQGILFDGYGYGVPSGGDPADYPQYWAIPTDRSQNDNEFVSTRVRTFNQEIRLSNAAGTRLKWTVGAFYSRAVQTDVQIIYAPWAITNVINPLYGLSLDPNDPTLDSTIRSVDTQVAAFGQVDYKITPRLTATLGGRISRAVAAYSQAQSGFFSASGSNAVDTEDGRQAQAPWSGKVGLAWQVDPATMLYASASRGYRIGGANQAIPSGPVAQGGCGVDAPATYGSDTVNSFEVGAKGRAAGGRLRFEADSFYVQWKNIQQNLYLPCQFGYITNAGDARTAGFDLAAHLAVTKALTVNLATTYADARFTQTIYLPTATPGTAGSLLVADGDKVGGQGSSPWNITGGIDLATALANHATQLHIEDNFRSHDGGLMPTMHPTANNYAPDIPFNPAVNQVNARITVTFDRFDLAAYVNNIANAHPVLYRYQDSPQSSLFYAISVRPRTFGLSLDYRI
jgi:iron complex outermembrane recepter protein